MAQPKRFTEQEFADAWNAAASVEEVAIHFKLKPRTASMVACKLRRAGFSVNKKKKQKKHGTPQEVERT